MPPARRSAPRPQTTRCRYVDGDGRACRNIATRPDGFCQRCAGQLEEDLSHSPLVDVVTSLFTGRRVPARTVERAGQQLGDFVHARIAQRWPGIGGAADPLGPGRAPAGARGPQPPRPRVSPEAIERRKAILAARARMNFEADEPLDEPMIRKRRQELTRIYHQDSVPGAPPDPTREKMMRALNAAATLLIEAARAAAAKATPPPT